MQTTSSSSRRRLSSGTVELIVGAVIVALFVIAAFISPWLYPDNGTAMDLMARLQAPFQSWAHPLGTDPIGRDVLARVMLGSRISLSIGVSAAVIGCVLGTSLGLLAGWRQGLTDMFVMRWADVQLALPFILVAITFLAIIGGGMSHVILLMVICQWVDYARVVRGQVLSLREREFVQASRAFGVSPLALVLRHILPNLLGPVVIIMTMNVATNILLESSLTFLGLGVDPTIPSWGGMLADGRAYMQTAWWVCVFPGLAIMLSVLGLNLLGDSLRDRMDPLQRKR